MKEEEEDDCLQDDDSFLSRNSFDDPLTQIDCIYSFAAELKSFPNTKIIPTIFLLFV